MTRRYLIDGYNLLHALGLITKRVAEGELESARRRLLDFLLAAFDINTDHVTIVFDAQHGPRGVARLQEYHGLHLDFAPKTQTADDRIEDLLEASSDPRQLVVISNDRRIQEAARHHHAQSWSHDVLLDFLDQRRAAKPEPAREADDKPPRTAEETERWLREFGDLESDPELREAFDHDRFD